MNQVDFTLINSKNDKPDFIDHLIHLKQVCNVLKFKMELYN